MKFIRSVSKLFLFILVLAGIYSVAISWINPWISSSEIALVYDHAKDTSTIVSPDSQTFVFERAIPRRTTLITLSATTQRVRYPYNYLLPGAELFSKFYGMPLVSFEYDLEIQIDYELVAAGLDEYLIANGKEDFESKLQENVSSLADRLVTEYFVSLSSTIVYDPDKLITKLSASFDSLPIVIKELYIKTNRSPILSIYNELESQLLSSLQNDSESDQGSGDFSIAKNKSELMLYLSFVSELSKLTEDNPRILDVIDRFTPAEFLNTE